MYPNYNQWVSVLQLRGGVSLVGGVEIYQIGIKHITTDPALVLSFLNRVGWGI